MTLHTGCRLISERTVAGEKYQTPSGQWKTRDGSAPELDVLSLTTEPRHPELVSG
ncbi:hypothetical protein [Sphingorhabdus sp.]|jgi:hypothetical protein|uniref:hypothetical protein n=1 Tax=Sphingorhabdus sp. TaxID=1902408 RepID=UPI003784515C